MRPRHLLLAASFLTALVSRLSAAAMPLYFSDAGGPFMWDQGTATTWSMTTGGMYNQLWSDGSDAHFEGTAGTVNVSGTINSVNSIFFNVDGYTLSGGTITLTGTGGNVTNAGGSDTINSVIAGSVGITENGAGTLILGSANTFAGGVTINGGTLRIANAGALNVTTPNALTFGASATADFQLSGNSITIGGLASNASPGTLTIENANSTPATLTVANPTAATSQTYNGVISDGAGSGALSFAKRGSNTSTLTLSGASANTFTGMTTVYNGNLILNKSGTVNAVGGNLTVDWTVASTTTNLLLGTSTTANLVSDEIPDTSTITFINTGSGGSGDFSVDGHSETIAGLIAPGSGTNGSTNQKVNIYNKGPGDTTAGIGTLTLNTPTGAYYFANVSSVTDAASGSSTLAITKSGPGTQGLVVTSFASSGNITLTGGALQIPGNKFPSKAKMVLNGGVLENYIAPGFTTTALAARLGTSTGQFTWAGDGGFAAYGGNATVSIGTNTSNDVWGTSASFLPNGARLLFGSQTSNALITYQSAINLGNDQRTIFVAAGAANSNSAAAISAAISSTTPSLGSLIVDGPGILTLSASNTYSGSTTVNQGTLLITNNNATTSIIVGTGSNAATFGGTGSAAAATATFSPGSTVDGGLSGAGTLTLAAATFNGAATYNLPINASGAAGLVVTGNNGFSTGGAAGASTISVTGNAVNPLVLPDTQTTHLIQFSGAIQGTGFAAFNPTLGSLPTTPRGITAALVDNSPQGYVDLNYSLNYITWAGANSNNWTDAGNWALSTDQSAVTFQDGDNVLVDDSAGAAHNMIHLDSTAANGVVASPHAVIVNNANVDYTIVGTDPNSAFGTSGLGSSKGAYLIKMGMGKLTLTGGNAFVGSSQLGFANNPGVILTQGTLAVSALVTNLGGQSGASTPILMNGGTLQWLGDGTNSIIGSAVEDPTASSTPNGLLIAAGKNAVFDTNGFNISFSDAFGGSGGTTGSVTKIGAGTLTFRALVISSNPSHESYTGGTTISAGTLSFCPDNGEYSLQTGASALAGTGPITMNGGTLQWGDGIPFNGITIVNTNDVSTQNGIVMVNGKTATFDTNGNAVILATGFGGGTSAALVYNDSNATPGSLTIGGVTTYTGGTTVNSGTLRLGGAGTLGDQTAAAGALTVDTAGILDLNATSQGVGNFTGSGGTVLNNGSGAAVLTIGNGNGNGGNYAGVIADNNNAGTGRVAITKTGSGTITLSGANSYSGVTTITGGTLALMTNTASNIPNSVKIIVGDSPANSSARLDVTGVSASGGFHITAGQTLAGHGTVLGNVAVDGGAALAPGNGVPGTLTVSGNLTLSGTTVSNFEIQDAGTYDKIAGANTIVFGGTLEVTAIGSPAFAGGQIYNLFNWTGSASGAFSSVTLPALTGGLQWKQFGAQQFDYSTGEIVVQATGSANWNLNGNGSYSVANNWDPQQLPVGIAQTATFGNGATPTTVTTGAVQVLVDGSITLGSIIFNNTNGTDYTIASDFVPGDGLTLNNNGSGASITVSNGDSLISADLTLADTLGSTIGVSSGASLTVTGAIANGGYLLTVTGSGDTTISNAISGSGGLVKSGTGTLTLSHANSYSGTTVNAGTLTTTVDSAIGNGSLAVNSSVAGATVVNLGGNESVGDLSGTVSAGSATVNVAAGKSLTVNPATSATFGGSVALAAGGAPETGGTLTKSGAGTEILTGVPQLGDGSVLNVNGGTLRLNSSTGAPSVGVGVKAVISGGSTLELAGAVSALGVISPANQRVEISTASPADVLLVSGGSKQVGGIDGTGVVDVAPPTGSLTSLTANHIVAGSLIIGGDATSAAVVTIAASNPDGTPLAQPSGLALADALTTGGSFASDGLSSSSLLAAGSLSSGGSNGDGSELGGLNVGGGVAAVPEPSTLLLLAIGGLACLYPPLRRRVRA